MPNWCNTAYKIIGNKEEIADLYKKLQELEAMQTPLVENGFGNLWLGCLVSLFGGDPDQIYCRGEIDYMELFGDEMIQLSTTTAWGDMPEVWDLVCEKYTSLSYYFLSEEPGVCYYINSDDTGEYFPELYIIDGMEVETEYANSDEELFESMAKLLEVDEIKDFEELNIYLSLYNEDNPEEGIYYHEFKRPNNE